MGFHLVSRLRDYSYLIYPTKEQRTEKKGRPKKFDGKVDFSNLDYSRFEKLNIQQDGDCYTAILFPKSLNATVRVVIWKNTINSFNHYIFHVCTQTINFIQIKIRTFVTYIWYILFQN